MAARWWRLLKHRLHDERDVARQLDAAALQRIQARVTASEQQHSGEIRVCVEAGLPWSYLRRHATPRERAVALFGKLRVWDTEHNNGVLIYLLLAERAIEIVADRGLNRQVDAAQWQAIAESMRLALQNETLEAALNGAIDAIDALLRQHFALAPGTVHRNQLPDAPLLR